MPPEWPNSDNWKDFRWNWKHLYGYWPQVGVEEKMKVFSSCFKEMFVLTQAVLMLTQHPQSLISGCVRLLINCIWLPRSIWNTIGQSVLLCACYDSARPLLRLFCLYGNKNSYELPDGLCRWRLGAKIKSLMYNWGRTCLVIAHQKNMRWGCTRRDKLAALEIDSRCLHVVSFAYSNFEAGGVVINITMHNNQYNSQWPWRFMMDWETRPTVITAHSSLPLTLTPPLSLADLSLSFFRTLKTAPSFSMRRLVACRSDDH